MNWDKKIYPKDVWNWLKKILGLTYIFGSSDGSLFKKYMKKKKLKRPQPWPEPPKRGGFTPRRSVSRISTARFDRGMAQLDRAIEMLDSKLEELDFEDILEYPHRMSDEDKWAMRNYDLAERTGLWDTNMSDGPLIDGTPNRKLKK